MDSEPSLLAKNWNSYTRDHDMSLVRMLTHGINYNTAEFFRPDGTRTERKTLQEFYREDRVNGIARAYEEKAKRFAWDDYFANNDSEIFLSMSPPWRRSSSIFEHMAIIRLLKDDGEKKKQGDKGYLVIESLQVNPAFKGLQIGAKLTENIFNLAQAAGYRGVKCIAGESQGMQYWPNVMRFDEESRYFGGDIFGGGKNKALGHADFKAAIAENLKEMREHYIPSGLVPEKYDALSREYRLDDMDDEGWPMRVIAFNKIFNADEKILFSSRNFLGWRLSTDVPLEGNMVHDFSNASDVERANKFFDKARRKYSSLAVAVTADKFIKERGPEDAFNFAELSLRMDS